MPTFEGWTGYSGFSGQLKKMPDSVAWYNQFCYAGRDEDFGKDTSSVSIVGHCHTLLCNGDRPDKGRHHVGPMVIGDRRQSAGVHPGNSA